MIKDEDFKRLANHATTPDLWTLLITASTTNFAMKEYLKLRRIMPDNPIIRHLTPLAKTHYKELQE